MADNTLIFIDGEYLSLLAKALFDGKYPNFDIKEFAIALAKEQCLWAKGIYYYTAPPYQRQKATKLENERRSRYDKFVSAMRKRHSVVVREGRCQKTNEGFRQKGVDTLLTMDLILAPIKYDIKRIILVTCDTDFVPIIEHLKSELQISTTLYYYVDRERGSRFSMSNYLLTACDRSLALQKHHFIKVEIRR